MGTVLEMQWVLARQTKIIFERSDEVHIMTAMFDCASSKYNDTPKKLQDHTIKLETVLLYLAEVVLF